MEVKQGFSQWSQSTRPWKMTHKPLYPLTQNYPFLPYAVLHSRIVWRIFWCLCRDQTTASTNQDSRASIGRDNVLWPIHKWPQHDNTYLRTSHKRWEIISDTWRWPNATLWGWNTVMVSWRIDCGSSNFRGHKQIVQMFYTAMVKTRTPFLCLP